MYVEQVCLKARIYSGAVVGLKCPIVVQRHVLPMQSVDLIPRMHGLFKVVHAFPCVYMYNRRLGLPTSEP